MSQIFKIHIQVNLFYIFFLLVYLYQLTYLPPFFIYQGQIFKVLSNESERILEALWYSIEKTAANLSALDSDNCVAKVLHVEGKRMLAVCIPLNESSKHICAKVKARMGLYRLEFLYLFGLLIYLINALEMICNLNYESAACWTFRWISHLCGLILLFALYRLLKYICVSMHACLIISAGAQLIWSAG